MVFPHCLCWSRCGCSSCYFHIVCVGLVESVVHVISTLFVLVSLGCSSCDFHIVCVGLVGV